VACLACLLGWRRAEQVRWTPEPEAAEDSP
jgi:hypothetical protein